MVADAPATVAEHLEAKRVAEKYLAETWVGILLALDRTKIYAEAMSAGRDLVLQHGTEARRLADQHGIEAEGLPPEGWAGPEARKKDQELGLALLEVVRQAIDGQRVDPAALIKAKRKAAA